MKMRTERDSLGELLVPADALYGAQTQRAINNFPISGQPMPAVFVRALLLAKQAAAQANAELGLLPLPMAEAIARAVDELLAGDFMVHFPVDVFQTGSGTSSNMNANEVLSTLASRHCGLQVNANDHVNCSQSSNDTIPSCIHIGATLLLSEQLLPALEQLEVDIRSRARDLDALVKTGRTHLMDAMPVRMSQCLQAWAGQLAMQRQLLLASRSDVMLLAQGGTAVGSGVNAHKDFASHFCAALNAATGMRFHPADNFFTHIGGQDTAVALSGHLRGLAVVLMKVANDLRWMNSGPLAGLGEIELEALQPGSSIMPGKVNPVIPEAAAMVATQVMGNDAAIAVAGQSGNFELNVMLPLIARNLLESLSLLAAICPLMARAISRFRVREDRLADSVARNPVLVTALNPIIGYQRAAEVAKAAYQQQRPIVDVAEEMTELSRDELEQILDPQRLTRGGLPDSSVG